MVILLPIIDKPVCSIFGITKYQKYKMYYLEEANLHQLENQFQNSDVIALNRIIARDCGQFFNTLIFC